MGTVVRIHFYTIVSQYFFTSLTLYDNLRTLFCHHAMRVGQLDSELFLVGPSSRLFAINREDVTKRHERLEASEVV